MSHLSEFYVFFSEGLMSYLGQVLPVARAGDSGTGLCVVCILAAVTSANTALRAAPNLGRHNAEILGSLGWGGLN
jgi:hypothetical protein